MIIYDKGEMLIESKALCVSLKRSLNLVNIEKEIFHGKNENNFISATRDTKNNTLFITIDINKIKEIIKSE